MSILLAVIKDLVLFAKDIVFVLLKPRKTIVETKRVDPEPTSSVPVQALPFSTPETPIGMSSIGYTTASPTRVFLRPYFAVDTVTAILPLGCAVSVLSLSGRFARIEATAASGWVLKDEITYNKLEVWPELLPGTSYQASDPKTRCIRALIADEFFARELYLPLQPTEYVTYALRVANQVLTWSEERPRLVGRWHILQKGRPGIVIGIEPKTGSVVEFLSPDTLALGYVQAVFVDASIKVALVGRVEEGVYEELVLKKDEWQAWQAIFIQIL